MISTINILFGLNYLETANNSQHAEKFGIGHRLKVSFRLMVRADVYFADSVLLWEISQDLQRDYRVAAAELLLGQRHALPQGDG